MKVSVVMLAYNHDRYVADALESALAQEADYTFEIVVGEDCSTDNTRKVIQSYADKYPAIVKPLFREKNLGMQRNNVDTIQHCTGEYLAILDSDDLWTARDKLSKQVGLMDSDPSHVVGFHRATVMYEDGKSSEVIPKETPNLTLRNLLITNFIPSCTTMYRRSAVQPFPDWYYGVTTYDWPLHIMTLSGGGKIAFLDEVMATYRVHGTGIWSGQSERQRLEKELHAYGHIVDYVPAHLKPQAKLGMAERLFDLANNYRRAGEKANAREAFRKALSLESEGHRMPLRRKLRLGAQLSLMRQ